MATSQASEVIRHLRTTVLLRDGAGLTDGQLLTDYLSRHDDAALAALVRRHAPMVWGVCRRVLHNHHDAEDAFQATFLVLVRRAASIASRELLANWLYGVAHQTALKARAMVAKRKGRERQVADMPEPAVAEQDLWDDLRPALDEELSRLPDKYRVVIVLFDLEGKTRKEVALQLGLPEGTVASRLTRARAMLARRLAQRGVTLSGGALAAVLSQNAASAGVPTSVVSSTIKAVTLVAAGQVAAGLVSVKVAGLTEGVLKTMLLTKLKTVTVVLLVVAGLLGAAGLIYQTQAADQPKDSSKVVQAPKPTEKEASAPATPAEKTSPKNAKVEQKVLTPEEAIKQRAKKVTVQFKVSSVLVNQSEDELPIEGPGGPFVRLVYGDGSKFSVLLGGRATFHMERLGINEPDKYFTGKLIRATGHVSPVSEGPPYRLLVLELANFQVVTAKEAR